jgi:hypothetical protein
VRELSIDAAARHTPVETGWPGWSLGVRAALEDGVTTDPLGLGAVTFDGEADTGAGDSILGVALHAPNTRAIEEIVAR